MGEVPSPSSSTMPGPGRAWVTPGPGGGPWSATAHSFVQHQLSHAVNFWRQGRPAAFHLQSRSDGQAVLNLTFQFPSPSEIIPPPSPYSTTPLPTSRRPVAPTPPPKRPIVPLFPPGEAPHFPPFPSHPTPLSSRQRKSYQRSAIHRAARAAPNPPQHPQAAPTFPPLQEDVTKPTSPLPPRKRPRSSSLPPSPGSSPVTLPQQLRRDFNIQELESPGSSPRQEILREERPPSSSPSLSLNLSSPDRRDALPCPALPCPAPQPWTSPSQRSWTG